MRPWRRNTHTTKLRDPHGRCVPSPPSQDRFPRSRRSLARAPQRLEQLAHTLAAAARRHPGSVAAALALVGLSSLWLRQNYLEFKALGPGGLPYTARGWAMALVLKLFARETLSTAEYDRDSNKDSWIDGKESIPRRKGPRPNSGFHVVPARPFYQSPAAEVMKVRLCRILRFEGCALIAAAALGRAL